MKLSLYADLLVRFAVWKELGIRNSDIIMAREAGGKPYLVGYTSFKFNVSHTNNAIVVGTSSSSIGVDIERVKSARIRIAQRFFTDLELKYICAKTEETDERFYEIWTQKEAYLKYTGLGMTIPLNSFCVLNPDISAHLRTIKYKDYLISYCLEEFAEPMRMVEIQEQKFNDIVGLLNS